MDSIYDKLVEATRQELIKNPDLTEKQIKGYVEYLGVFVPSVRDRIIKQAKELLK
jgi:hypothetical protein